MASRSTNTYLTPVKSSTFYVSEFVGATTDPCYTKGLIETNPTIYKTGNSFFIDYSHSTNSSDLKFLKRLFGSLTAGNTLTIVGGTYYVQDTGQQYNFAGTYTLAGCTGLYKQYINLTGITYPTNLSDGVYSSEKFLNPVKWQSQSGNTSQYYQVRVNKQDPFNVDFFGIYGNDYGYEEYIEINGSSTNSLRAKIDSAIKLNDGSQIIYINPSSSITSENLYFVPVTATLYMRGVPDLLTLSQNKNVNGILKKIDDDGNTIEIFDKQNLHQRYCRSVTYSSYYYDWYAGYPNQYNQNIYNPDSYNSLSLSINYFSFVKIITTVTNTYNLTADNTFDQVNTTSLVVDGVVTNTANYSSQSLTDPIIKIDLSDSSLYSWTIEPFTDIDCSNRLNASYFLNGIPGFDGSSFIYLKTNQSPSTIYLKFSKDISLVLQIVV